MPKRWTCWWWPTSIRAGGYVDIPVPYERTSNDLDVLLSWAQDLADSGNVEWVRVFASDDEYDERFRWSAALGFTDA